MAAPTMHAAVGTNRWKYKLLAEDDHETIAHCLVHIRRLDPAGPGLLGAGGGNHQDRLAGAFDWRLGPHGGLDARRRQAGDCRDQRRRWRAGALPAGHRTRRRSKERTRCADRPGVDQQGKSGCRRRLHQHRRGAGLAALLPRGQDSGHQQRRHRLHHHQAVCRPARKLRLAHLGQRHHPDPYAGGRSGHAPEAEQDRHPGGLDQLRPAGPRRPGGGAGGQGHQGGGGGKVQPEGR